MTLQVYKNGCDWVVAESLDDCWERYTKLTGIQRSDEDMGQEADPFGRVPDDVIIKILVNDKGEIDDHGKPLALTAAEWANREGAGLLCSSEY